MKNNKIDKAAARQNRKKYMVGIVAGIIALIMILGSLVPFLFAVK